MKTYIFFVQIGLILLFCLSAVAQGDPVVLDPNFYIEKFVDVNFPTAIEIPPPNSPFGNFLYVSSSSVGYGGPPDPIFRIDLSIRELTTFFTLPGESDPAWMVFGPGLPFTTNLYICSNNRDGGRPGDYGGSIVFLEPVPDINGEQFLTPPPPPTVLSEPASMAFGPGGAFGTDLYVTNTSVTPFDIALISPNGARSTFVYFPTGETYSALAFGPGGAFGSDLFVLYSQDGTIYIVDPNGNFTPFVSIEGFEGSRGTIVFAPPGSFGQHMYVGAQVSDEFSILRVTPEDEVTEFARGFADAAIDRLAFSNDGRSLFFSDRLADIIYRISQPRGDMDNDYDVDFVDFALFAIRWRDTGCGPQNNWCGKADNNGDSEVGLKDLAGLAKNWLEGVNP